MVFWTFSKEVATALDIPFATLLAAEPTSGTVVLRCDEANAIALNRRLLRYRAGCSVRSLNGG